LIPVHEGVLQMRIISYRVDARAHFFCLLLVFILLRPTSSHEHALILSKVSTKASWTNIAYTSWWGCGNWQGDSYSELGSPFYPGQESDHSSRVITLLGVFQGFKCDEFRKEPVMTAVFFGCYLVLTAWVVMSLFVGVISIGIFEAFEAMKRETKRLKYERKIKKQARRKEAVDEMKAAMVTATEEEADAYISKARDPLDDLPDLRDKIDNVLHPDMSEHVENLWFMRAWVQVGIFCRDIEEMPWFTNTITTTIIVVAFMTGVDADASMVIVCVCLRVIAPGRCALSLTFVCYTELHLYFIPCFVGGHGRIYTQKHLLIVLF
jgi:general stress protein CsbA